MYIPNSVFYDRNLVADAKLLYAEIKMLSQKEGFCWASNSHFAGALNASVRSVQRWILSLEKEGHIIISINKNANNRREISMTPVSPPMTPVAQPHDTSVTPIIGINNINEYNKDNIINDVKEPEGGEKEKLSKLNPISEERKLKDFANQLWLDKYSIEKRLESDNNFTMAQLPGLLKVFISQKISEGKSANPNFGDFRKNFYMWIPKFKAGNKDWQKLVLPQPSPSRASQDYIDTL